MGVKMRGGSARRRRQAEDVRIKRVVNKIHTSAITVPVAR